MKLVLMHDSAPDGLPGHIGVVRNVESMGAVAIMESVWQMIVVMATQAELVRACGKAGEQKEPSK